jgi:hypothetical protein
MDKVLTPTEADQFREWRDRVWDLKRQLAVAQAQPSAAICACGDHCQADGALCVTCANELRDQLAAALRERDEWRDHDMQSQGVI